MTGATPASPKHLAWRLQRRRSVPPRPRSDRASRRAQIDHKGTRVVAQADESTRSIHRDVGKQYFVKISLSAGPVVELVGIEGGVVSGVFNLESSGVEAPDRRPRHEEHYHEA